VLYTLKVISQDQQQLKKTKGVNIGYNLGPVAMTVGYAQNTDVGGTTGAENNQGMIRFIGAF